MPTSHRRPANKHSKHKTRRRKTQHQLLRGMLFVFAVLMLGFGLFLWKAALELNAPAESTVSVSAVSVLCFTAPGTYPCVTVASR